MKCKYCGKSAGLFSFEHKECKEAHDNSMEELRRQINNSLRGRPNYAEIYSHASTTMNAGHIKPDEFDDIFYTVVMSEMLKSQEPYSLLTFVSTLPTPLLNKFKKAYSFISIRDKVVCSKIGDAFKASDIDKDIYSEIRGIAESTGFTKLNELIVNEIDRRVDTYLEDGIIEPQEEESLKNFIECTGISVEEISKSPAYEHYIQSLVLRDIQEGKMPSRVAIASLPILLAKKEYPIWAYTNVKGYERKTGKEYVGGSRGVGVRLCKGVYYRTGASKGHSVDYQYTQPLGSGTLIITNKALYFVNQVNTVKVLISKIVSVEPFSDGIGIVKDGARPRPIYYEGFDSWFMMNLLPLLTD